MNASEGVQGAHGPRVMEVERLIEAPAVQPVRPQFPSPARRRAVSVVFAQLLAAAAMLLLGVGLRPAGLYSDIPHLYGRDALWRHPLPYVDYALEYPVGTGLAIWLAGFVPGGYGAYFAATAAVLVVAGLLTVWLGHRFDGANPWLLALSPALPLYVVLNWDLLAVLPAVAALLLFRCGRDGWGAGLLAAAVWIKLFPLVLVPLVVLDRALKRGWRAAFLIGGVFIGASVLINAPFALRVTPTGFELREGWLYFFRFHRDRPSEVNLWSIAEWFGVSLSVERINAYSAVLLVLGLGVVMGLLWHAATRGDGRTRDLVLPGMLAALGWWFFVNKSYSPQYSLWIAVLLALLAAPPALAVAFAGVDLAYFALSFITLHLLWSGSPAAEWVYRQLLQPAMVVREAAILVVIVWAARRMLRGRPGDAPRAPAWRRSAIVPRASCLATDCCNLLEVACRPPQRYHQERPRRSACC